jgi:hypothetical protein
MKVSGFSFIKNAIIYDYPIVEAIKSILPICDEFIVAVGKSDDETLTMIQNIDINKIRIIETVWDESLRQGGQVLAVETDKALKAISNDSDWAFYIQGDEIVHETYLQTIRENMIKYKDDSTVDGLLFNYLHFYGSYDYVGASSNWYRHEIRIIKNNSNIYSYRDAQGFRKDNNQKLHVIPIDAWIYHYGWIKDPKAMQRKQISFNRLYHDDLWVDQNIIKSEEFDYGKHVTLLKPFDGTHPEVMKDRIARTNWKFDFDITRNTMSLKDKTKAFLRKYFGIDLGYKNYIKIN